jgi:CheY-like chemotaxis protein
MRDGDRNSPAPARILLVDDNRLGLTARKSVLEELGHRITTALHGEEALELFSSGAFDLVITDYRMPKMDGFQLIKSIRALAPAPPIILISGYAEALGMTEANTGADAVICKNANEVTHLVREVNRLLLRAAPRKPSARQSSRLRAKRGTA